MIADIYKKGWALVMYNISEHRLTVRFMDETFDIDPQTPTRSVEGEGFRIIPIEEARAARIA